MQAGCTLGGVTQGLGVHAEAAAPLLWVQKIQVKLYKLSPKMFFPGKGRSTHTHPHFLLSLEESPGPTKVWKSFSLLTGVDPSGPVAEAARAVPGGQCSRTNTASWGRAKAGASPDMLLLGAALAPLSPLGEGGSVPGPVGHWGWRGRQAGPPTPQQGGFSCAGFSLSAFTVFACFTSSVQRGRSEEERSCVHVRRDLVTHPPEARASFAAGSCVKTKQP